MKPTMALFGVPPEPRPAKKSSARTPRDTSHTAPAMSPAMISERMSDPLAGVGAATNSGMPDAGSPAETATGPGGSGVAAPVNGKPHVHDERSIDCRVPQRGHVRP